MRDLISLTNAADGSPFTVAVHAIGIIEPHVSYESGTNAMLILSMGKSGKKPYLVKETYEEIIKRIEAAQQPATGII